MKKILFLMDWGIFGLRAYWYILLLLQIVREGNSGPPFVLTLLWCLVAFVLPFYFWIPQIRKNKERYGIAEVFFGGSFYVYMILMTGKGSNLFLIPMLSIGYMLTRKNMWLALAVLVFPYIGTIFQVLSFLEATGWIADGLLFISIGLWVNVIAHAYRKNSQLIVEVENKNKLLTQYSEQVERMTLLEERNRMSKELHDVLGHSYISLIMGLDAAIALLDKSPEVAKEKMIRLRDLTEQNIHEMRNVVHKIGEEENGSLTEKISELIESFKEYTGVDIISQVSGPEQGLSSVIRQTIIRTIQESFTNAVKHGKATRINLYISYASHQVNVAIYDNGIGGTGTEFGFGLTAMKSRIENLNGQLQISVSSQKGTEVRCQIPIKGGA